MMIAPFSISLLGHWSTLRGNLKINFRILKAFLIFLFYRRNSKQVGLLRKGKALFRIDLTINGEASTVHYILVLVFIQKENEYFCTFLTSRSQGPKL